MALQRQGRLREAEKIYTRVLKAAPDHFDALNLLGIVKAQLGRIGRSASTAQPPRSRSIRARRGAWANLGQVLHALKRAQEALECLDKARALAPDDVAILNQHANALLSLGRAEEALDEFRQVLARVPQHAEARLNCGIAHAALGFAGTGGRGIRCRAGDRARPSGGALQSRRSLCTSSAVTPPRSMLMTACWLRRPNMRARGSIAARALAALNRLDEAVASYGKAGAIRKDDADVHFSEAMALLTLGDYRRGFEKYEGALAAKRHAARRRAAAGRCGSANIRWRARPCCCTPSRGSATRSSSRATCRFSPRPAPRSCSKCRAN